MSATETAQNSFSSRKVELQNDVVIMEYDTMTSGRNDKMIHVEMSNEAMRGGEDSHSMNASGGAYLLESAQVVGQSPGGESFDILAGTQTNTVQSIEPDNVLIFGANELPVIPTNQTTL